MKVNTNASPTPVVRPRTPQSPSAAETPARRGDGVDLSGPQNADHDKALVSFANSRGVFGGNGNGKGNGAAFQGRVTSSSIGPMRTSPLGNAQAIARQMQESSHGKIKVHDVKLVNGVPMISFQAPGVYGPSECRMLVADSSKLKSWGGADRRYTDDVAGKQGALAAVNGTFSADDDAYPVGDVVGGNRRMDAAPIPRQHSYIAQTRPGGEWTMGLAGPTGKMLTERYNNGTEKVVNTYDVPAGVRRSATGLMAGGAPLLVNGQNMSALLDHKDNVRVNRQSFTDNVAQKDKHTAVGFSRDANNRQQVLLLTTDTNIDLKGVANIFQAAGCRDAMALDGGHATQMTAGTHVLDFNQNRSAIPSMLLIGR